MLIPKSFKLLGQTITVEYDDALRATIGAHGTADYNHSKITLQTMSDQNPVTQESIEHTFFHELVHHILYIAGSDTEEIPLHAKEYFVDLVGGLFHQAMTTMEYEEDDSES